MQKFGKNIIKGIIYIYKHFFMLNKNPDTKKNNESFGFL